MPVATLCIDIISIYLYGPSVALPMDIIKRTLRKSRETLK